MKAMLKGGGGGSAAKAAKVEKKIQKMADKETKRLAKDIPVAKKVAGNERYQAKVNSLRAKAAVKATKTK